MCKYCDLKQYNNYEKGNDNQTIILIKDGSQLFEVSINRYILEGDKKRDADLIMNLSVNIGGGLYPVKTKEIKIKYCPFCGEKL